MLDSLAEVMTEKGYVATTVSDIIKRAGVSRETFYQQFDSKQDCFSQAFDDATASLIGALGTESRPLGTPLERFERLLGRYLGLLAANSGLARLFLVDVYAAGPEANRRRGGVQELFVDAVIEMFSATAETDRFACEALVASTSAMVTDRLVTNSVAALPLLREPLVKLAERLLAGRKTSVREPNLSR